MVRLQCPHLALALGGGGGGTPGRGCGPYCPRAEGGGASWALQGPPMGQGRCLPVTDFPWNATALGQKRDAPARAQGIVRSGGRSGRRPKGPCQAPGRAPPSPPVPWPWDADVEAPLSLGTRLQSNKSQNRPLFSDIAVGPFGCDRGGTRSTLAGGGWRLAVGGRRLAVGGWWRLAIGGWRRLVAVGDGWLVGVSGWRLAVGG